MTIDLPICYTHATADFSPLLYTNLFESGIANFRLSVEVLFEFSDGPADLDESIYTEKGAVFSKALEDCSHFRSDPRFDWVWVNADSHGLGFHSQGKIHLYHQYTSTVSRDSCTNDQLDIFNEGETRAELLYYLNSVAGDYAYRSLSLPLASGFQNQIAKYTKSRLACIRYHYAISSNL